MFQSHVYLGDQILSSLAFFYNDSKLLVEGFRVAGTGCRDPMHKHRFFIYSHITNHHRDHVYSSNKICPGLNANEMHALYNKHHKVSSLINGSPKHT